METLKTIWDFFQNEVLGMNWLNRLIETFLNACGLDTTGKIGGSVQFFIYDTVKIMVLLGVLILIISYIQSYFPPERAKKILGRFHGIGAGCKSCHEQFEYTKQAVKDMGLSVEVEFITDMQKVMEYGVMSMPALVVNEKVVAMGKVLKAADVVALLHKLGF